MTVGKNVAENSGPKTAIRIRSTSRNREKPLMALGSPKRLQLHTRKTSMEPENHIVGKEKHLANILFFGFHLGFRGCRRFVQRRKKILQARKC